MTDLAHARSCLRTLKFGDPQCIAAKAHIALMEEVLELRRKFCSLFPNGRIGHRPYVGSMATAELRTEREELESALWDQPEWWKDCNLPGSVE